MCALLNDLFGVQSRGGCQCAGPYSQRLLGISLPNTRAVETELLRKHELLRPGFSRFSLAYVNSDQEVGEWDRGEGGGGGGGGGKLIGYAQGYILVCVWPGVVALS